MKTTTKEDTFTIASKLLDRNAARCPNKVATYCREQQVNYGELLENVNRFANVLAKLGVKPTERVMIHLPDSPMFVYAFFASIKHGAWPVPVNTTLEITDYEYLLRDSEERVLVTEKTSKGARAKIDHLCYWLFADNDLEWNLAKAAKEAEAYPSGKEDILFWVYSSASTGKPKPVPHRHIHTLHSADTYALTILSIREDDICFSVSKLFFTYGLGNGLSFPLRHGAPLVLLSTPPSPESVMEIIATFKPTIFFGVPTQYNSVLKKIGSSGTNSFSSVRVCVSADEALPPAIFNKWKETTGLEIADGIGSAEALHIFIPNLSLPWVSVIPHANRREARKLGLLRKQKFRSRRRARVAAGANERVCEEWPTPTLFLTTNLGLSQTCPAIELGHPSLPKAIRAPRNTALQQVSAIP